MSSVNELQVSTEELYILLFWENLPFYLVTVNFLRISQHPCWSDARIHVCVPTAPPPKSGKKSVESCYCFGKIDGL